MRSAARLAAALIVALAGSLSWAQDGASYPLPPTVPNPSLVDGVAPAPPGVAAPSAVVAAPPPAAPALSPPAVPALEPEADIALVLPLRSPDYARAAEAVRDGFVAAADAAGLRDRCRVIAHEDGRVREAFDEAVALGVRIIVGPLVRDDLRTVAASDAALPLTLALNQLDDGTPLPPTMYALSLSIEADARVLARRLRADQAYSVALIGGTGPLDRRFAAAFADAWRAAGGGTPETYRFDAAPEALGQLRRDIARSTAQAAVVTLPGAQAALARSFAPRLPAYASSLVNEALDTSALADLEGVVFVDVPWLVRPDDDAFARLRRPDFAGNALQRLYALGLDAFALARTFQRGVPERLDLAGATGRLTLGEGRVLVREGALAMFQQGQVVPVDAAR